MKMNKTIHTVLWLVALSLMVSAFGCSRGLYVYVQQDKYTPQLHENLNVYKGTAVFLNSFENRAQNTSMFYYYSPDFGVTYEGSPSLHSYVWYCFKKAFTSLGMRVYEADPPADVPEIRLVFTTLTDREFKFEVTVLKDGQEVFKNTYAIAAPAPEDMRPEALEERAYRMIDAAVSSILFDQKFQQSLY
jgi:hypothetical protein